MFTFDVISLVSIVYMGIVYVLLAPTMIYCLYIFNKQYDQDEELMKSLLQNRPLSSVYSINILVIFTICIERLYIVVTQILIPPYAISWTVYLFLSATWMAIYILFAIKAYCLYFEQQYNASIADMVWTKEINPSVAENNWFTNNIHTFGNFIYLIKICIIPYILSVVLITTISSFHLNNLLLFTYLYGTFVSIPIIISFILLWRLRALNHDIYGIKNEVCYQSFLLSIFLILLFLSGVVLKSSDFDNRLYWICNVYITYIPAISLTYFSTLFKICFFEKQKKTLNFQNKSFSSLGQFKIGEITTTDKAIITDLEAVISRYEPFKCFMNYLISEFSTENLLFLTELIQIKYAFQAKNNYVIRVPIQTGVKPIYSLNAKLSRIAVHSNSVFVDDDDDEDEVADTLLYDDYDDDDDDDKNNDAKYMTLDFMITEKDKNNDSVDYTFLYHNDSLNTTKLSVSSCLTKSAILTNGDNLCSQMIMLYNKYIKTGCNYELNISYDVRQALENYFENECDKIDIYIERKEYYQLFNILDEVGLEILWLLQGSFQRFEQSRHFDPMLMNNLRKPLNEIYPNQRHGSSYIKLKKQYNIDA